MSATPRASPAGRPKERPWRQPLLLGAGIAALLYLLGFYTTPALQDLAKPIPAACLATLVLLERRDRYGRFIAAGLLISAVGDLLLESDGAFLMGLLAFLGAHIAYALAFFDDDPRPRLGRAVPFAVWLLVVGRWLWPRLGSMAGPVAVYMVAIGAMMWRAAARVDRFEEPTSGPSAALVGAVLFGLSDTILAIERFRSPVPYGDFLVMLLYWAGQTGIAASAVPFARRDPRRSGIAPSGGER